MGKVFFMAKLVYNTDGSINLSVGVAENFIKEYIVIRGISAYLVEGCK